MDTVGMEYGKSMGIKKEQKNSPLHFCRRHN
jgi:hypothetical protein